MTKVVVTIGLAIVLVIAITVTPVQATNQSQPVPEIKLGSVTVRGEKVIQVLQAIKAALQRPLSSDPKMANEVVCRIHNDIGSHLQQTLTCATNKTLLARTATTQLAWNQAISHPAGEPALSALADTLNEYLPDMPGQQLNLRLNGNSFRNLLDKVPMPAPVQTTVRIAVASSSLLTGHGQDQALQIGGIKVTGEQMIQKVLQTLKAGLLQPFSNHPELADVVVCRLNAERGNAEEQVLTCATNRVWSGAHGSLRMVMTPIKPPSTKGCTPTVVSQFSSALDALPQHYLQTSVDGARLHNLLDMVPDSCAIAASARGAQIPL